MEIKTDIIKSQFLNREISINIYGHYGIAILYFPSKTNSANEFYDNGGIAALEHLIKIGKCKFFCIDSIDNEMWLNDRTESLEKSNLHYNFNNFITEELVEYIFMNCGGPVPVLTAGAGIGGFHAMNTFFRRPDLFYGTIALSGFYDIRYLTGQYFDDNCYYNSPVHYLPNLNDNYWLSHIYSRRHIYLGCGCGENENTEQSEKLAQILSDKNIRHLLEIKDENIASDYKKWIDLFKYFFDTKL